MKKASLVSVIIVNWNGGRVLEDCLKSLLKIDYPRWELILVDNGSTDGGIEKIQKLKFKSRNYKSKLKILRNRTNLGFTVANNQGYKKTQGKYILLLNNDTKVTSDFLTGLVARAEEDPKIGVIQPKIFLMDKPGYLDNAGSFLTKIGFLQHWGFLEKDGEEFNRERDVFSVKGACMLIKRELVERVGLFDESFFSYFEESDFCWRVWLSGSRVLYFPKASIKHKVGFTIRRLDVPSVNYHYYKNRICSLIKNLELSNLLTILPLHLIISFGIMTLFLIRLKPKNSGMILKALIWNLTNLTDTLKKRARIQKMRVVNDSQIFKKLSRPINWQQYIKDFRRVEEDLKRRITQDG